MMANRPHCMQKRITTLILGLMTQNGKLTRVVSCNDDPVCLGVLQSLTDPGPLLVSYGPGGRALWWERPVHTICDPGQKYGVNEHKLYCGVCTRNGHCLRKEVLNHTVNLLCNRHWQTLTSV